MFNWFRKRKSGRLYVVTRRDLAPSYAACQSIHAAANLAFTHRDRLLPSWGHYGPTLVLLGVADEVDLWHELRAAGEEAVPFFEPDLDHELTAFAFYGHLDTRHLELL